MNSLDARLIELNDALLRLSSGQKIDDNIIQNARQALAGGITLNTGAGNDTVIINKNGSCATGPEGAIGATGPEGPPGATGPAGACDCDCNTQVVSEDYTATVADCYIGVDSTGPVTITLPADCETGQVITIKAQMGPPLGNRKITVTTSDESTIDGAAEYVIEVPYQNISVICVDGSWWII
jgi:hypothetical protein